MSIHPSRRDFLGAAALLGASGLHPALAATPRLRLAILATSDLHMALTDWDYYKARPDPTTGLSRVATLIAAARKSFANTLLVDNGDLLQGNPLADQIARGGLADGSIHPAYRVMNALRYDAATLGNHEFNYGLDFLERALRGSAFPQVSANIRRADGSTFLPATAILARRFVDEAGTAHDLKIGVIGFAPPQIMIWDKSNLEGRLATDDVIEAAERHVPALRAACDVVVALCHGGVGGGPRRTGEENAGLHLAEVPGIDVVVTGHSHRVLPGPDFSGQSGVDAVKGTLAGKPAVMPGFWGSHLGIVDLGLVRDGDRWRIADFACEARPIARRDGQKTIALVEPDAEVERLVRPEHEATRTHVDQPAGRFARSIDSYFVWTGRDPATTLVNRAQTDYARRLLVGTEYEKLPLLSAMAPFRAGYTPDSWIDIPAGPVALRQVADLYAYSNTLVVVKVTGALLREWLEHAARVFARIVPGAAEVQSLLEPKIPSYNFDVISGLTWTIDVSRPPRTDAQGRIVTPEGGRISDLKHEGRPIDEAAEFLVVTNNYRADGGGGFPGMGGDRVVLRAPDGNRDVVLKWVMEQGQVTVPDERPWRFAALGKPTTVAFDGAPQARTRLAEAPELREIAAVREGWARWAFDLA